MNVRNVGKLWKDQAAISPTRLPHPQPLPLAVVVIDKMICKHFARH